MKQQLSIITVGISAFLSMNSAAEPAGFVSPIGFGGSESDKAAIVDYIEARARYQYCEQTDMCQEFMLRQMEQQSLMAFKSLTVAENTKILESVIDIYCNQIDMCDYHILKQMYDQEVMASNQSLSWD